MASSWLSGVVRPTVIFGPEDILINNIAWMVRTFPVFAVPGSGDYLLQPVYVEDFADLAMGAAAFTASQINDATGPQILTYREIVERIAKALGRSITLVSTPIPLAYALGTVMGWFVHDVILTYEEVAALANSILYSTRPPSTTTRFDDWLATYKANLGREYRSELRRHFPVIY